MKIVHIQKKSHDMKIFVSKPWGLLLKEIISSQKFPFLKRDTIDENLCSFAFLKILHFFEIFKIHQQLILKWLNVFYFI